MFKAYSYAEYINEMCSIGVTVGTYSDIEHEIKAICHLVNKLPDEIIENSNDSFSYFIHFGKDFDLDSANTPKLKCVAITHIVT